VFDGDNNASVYYLPGTTGWGSEFDGRPTALWVPYTYTTNNGTITITGYTGPGGAVTIPSTIDGLPVTSIGDQAFAFGFGLTSVTIPSGVTSLGDLGFYWCTGLTNIAIPNSVTNIGDFAFANCARLVGVSIPTSVTSIGEGAFDNCTSLTSVIIPDSVINIGGGAFYSCTNLASVTLGNSVASLGDYAFYGCSSLTTINCRDNAPSIGTSVFSGDKNMTVYYLPGTTGWGPTFGGLSAVLWNPPVPFNYTTSDSAITITGYTGSASEVTFPSNINFLPVTTIGDLAFAYYAGPGLTNVTIPNSVTSIGYGAFTFCFSLSSVTIPRSVTNIGDQAFSSCSGLKAIMVDAENALYSSLNGVLFDNSQTTLIQYPGGLGGTYTIPASVSTIGNQAFSFCSVLTSVQIPGTVTRIGDDAFIACFGLTSVTIPGSVTNFGDYVFLGCVSLSMVMIADSISDLGEGAFGECDSLAAVFFMGNTPRFDTWVFDYYNHATIYYLSGTTGWGSTFAGRPTAVWQPEVHTSDASFGVRTNQFGFKINWAGGMVVVVEACTDLASPVWSPLRTNTLSSDSFYFSDPQWTNYPARFYRLRSP
jgi:hypothetical protein